MILSPETKRAINKYAASTTPPPLYNYELSAGLEVLRLCGDDAHNVHNWRGRPEFYIPREEWWDQQAQIITRL